MKMGKNSLGFEVFLTTMKEAANPLYMMFMYVCLAVVTYGCIMYYIEKGEYDFPDSEGGTGGEFGVYVVSSFLSLVCPQLTLLLTDIECQTGTGIYSSAPCRLRSGGPSSR